MPGPNETGSLCPLVRPGPLACCFQWPARWLPPPLFREYIQGKRHILLLTKTTIKEWQSAYSVLIRWQALYEGNSRTRADSFLRQGQEVAGGWRRRPSPGAAPKTHHLSENSALICNGGSHLTALKLDRLPTLPRICFSESETEAAREAKEMGPIIIQFYRWGNGV